MKRCFVFGKNQIREKIRRIQIKQHTDLLDYISTKRKLAGHKIVSVKEANSIIYDAIMSGAPFFAGRMGGNELSAMKMFDFEIKSKYRVVLDYLCTNAGFFPHDPVAGEKFGRLLQSSIEQIDLAGTLVQPFEEYYYRKFANSGMVFSHLRGLEPWRSPDRPWSAALEGKNVLVIYPLAKTIETQYRRREQLFPGTNILPSFNLKTLKAVQTVAGEKDERFETWFEALDWMYQEAVKIDFDVAIIGCGAYGFPLAARLKQTGKQAIHLGGATQLLFGIKGKRWVEDAGHPIQTFLNDAWVYPLDVDRPKNAEKVEGGCYW